MSAECVDDTRNGGSLALADEVEIEHALNSSCLKAADLLSVLDSRKPNILPTHYTKHRVFGWKRVCAEIGLIGLLGAANLLMLSSAVKPPEAVAGGPPLTPFIGVVVPFGTAEGAIVLKCQLFYFVRMMTRVRFYTTAMSVGVDCGSLSTRDAQHWRGGGFGLKLTGVGHSCAKFRAPICR